MDGPWLSRGSRHVPPMPMNARADNSHPEGRAGGTNHDAPAYMVWLVLGARAALAVVLALAAWPKLTDPASFASSIANYRVLPEAWVPVVAVWLPSLELCVAGALLWPRFARGAALLALGMLTVFTAAMGQAMARGIDLSCGCFGGAAQSPVGWGNIIRNLGLMVVAMAALWLPWPAGGLRRAFRNFRRSEHASSDASDSAERSSEGRHPDERAAST